MVRRCQQLEHNLRTLQENASKSSPLFGHLGGRALEAKKAEMEIAAAGEALEELLSLGWSAPCAFAKRSSQEASKFWRESSTISLGAFEADRGR